MTWMPSQVTNDEITPEEWNQMTQCILDVSSNSFVRFKSSSNVWKYASSQNISGGSLRAGTLYGNTISGIAWPIYVGSVVNKNYVDTISGSLVAKVGAGTLAGTFAGNIGSDGTYAITGTKHISSQMLIVKPASADNAIFLMNPASNKDSTVRFREGGTTGFSIKYSGATDNNFYILRDSTGDGTKTVIRVDRETGETSFGSAKGTVVKMDGANPYFHVSGVFKLYPTKRVGSTPTIGEMWLSGTTTVCGGFYGCTGNKWLKFSMV